MKNWNDKNGPKYVLCPFEHLPKPKGVMVKSISETYSENSRKYRNTDSYGPPRREIVLACIADINGLDVGKKWKATNRDRFKPGFVGGMIGRTVCYTYNSYR